ncbi:hypothetical protein H5A33_03700 [Pectobacterium brasiliense]|uniref:hypothetical protein n=1 Tax=Pectobacterium brasiliense TaxID=180957 RepID=UPI001968D9D1|nr:hypothetical protein [Pectobacterium brasiliense]MBN3253735.1 hypothetical protein [Pectobacterium brasiliense]
MELTRFDRFNHGDERTLSTTNFTRSLLLHGQDEYAGKSLKVDDNPTHVKGEFRPLILHLDVVYCKNLGYAQGTKKPPEGGFTILLITLIILVFPMTAGVRFEFTQREHRGVLNSTQDQ